MPAYELLGGLTTSRLRACASIIVDMEDLEATAHEFAGYAAQGYTAVKGGWGKNPATAFGLDADRDLALLRSVAMAPASICSWTSGRTSDGIPCRRDRAAVRGLRHLR